MVFDLKQIQFVIKLGQVQEKVQTFPKIPILQGLSNNLRIQGGNQLKFARK